MHQTMSNWPGGQAHMHMSGQSKVPQGPNVARLGPRPSLVAVTVAAPEAAVVMTVGERKDLGRAVTHVGGGSLSIIIRVFSP